jgi:hypothetical protein
MPLINLQTNLRSLGFGHDRPDGGSSNQPYIQNPIDVNFGVRQGTVGANILGSDFILRGGVFGAVSATANDVIRLSKFFNPLEKGASFNGALFTAKQLVLERQNVDVLDGRSRVYLPTNTIAQAGVNFLGGHLDRTGINPFKAGYYGDGDTGYYPVTLRNDTEEFSDGSHNRLQLLYQVKRLGNETSNSVKLKRQLTDNQTLAGTLLTTVGLLGIADAKLTGAPVGQQIFSSIGALSGLAILAASPKTKQIPIKLAANLYGITGTDDNVNLISYGGGPGSTLGIGNTNLRIWNPLQFKNNPFPSYTNITKNEEYSDNPDFYLTPSDGDAKTYYPLFRETKLNTSKTSFSRKRNGATKVINPNLAVSPDNDFDFGEDIIDFQFQLINNNGTNASPTTLNFRAYVEDFNDGFTGEWDTYRYVGRGENFYRYKGFSRDMSITFTAPVLSRADMINTYQKLNALIWSTTPDYSDDGLMRGSLMKFTMGDYLRDAVIIIKSVTLTPIMEMGFDINRDENYTRFGSGDDLYTGQLPKGIRVQCNITPLTQGVTDAATNTNLYYTPQRGEPFIGNTKHIIADRNSIITRYSLKGTDSKPLPPTFTPDNPSNSNVMTKTS